MLETLVASILNRVLGSYIENFDPNKLKIGLLSGDVKLEGLKLKRNILDKLQLPIDVLEGHVGNLILQIPYSNLKSKPVKVFIEDVFLLAGPEEGHSDAGQKRREQAQKLDKLALWEVSSERAVLKNAQNEGAAVSETDKQNQNFTSSLITKIVENVQITIRNIHIRFEEPNINSSVGLTLGELSAVSANSNWEPAFIANIGSTTQKLVTLDSLALYMDPEMKKNFGRMFKARSRSKKSDDFDHAANEENDLGDDNMDHLSSDSESVLLDQFKSFIFDTVGANDIIRPINGQGFVTINKQPKSEYDSKIKADLKFEELSLNLNREQYVNALQLIDYFQSYFKMLEFKRNRPRVPVKQDPLGWFRYAAQTVVDRVREKRKVWTWEYMKQRLDDQKLYVELYKKFYAAGFTDANMTPFEIKQFNTLQESYNYEDLILFRTIAKQIIISENKNKNLVKNHEQQQTWSQWLWGKNNDASTNSESTESYSNPNAISITDDQRQELLDMLDAPLVTDMTAAQVLLVVDFSLSSASIRIKNSKDLLLSAGLEGVKSSYVKRLNSFNVEASIMKAAVSDLSQTNRFSNTLVVQELDTDIPLVWFQFQHHPPDKMADSNLFLKLQKVVAIHNARLLDSIFKFFKPPPDQNETVEAIITAANKTVEDLREQTRLGLEYALEHHKTLNLQLDIKSPTLIIPLDPSDDNSAAAVLCVGALNVSSELVPQSVLNEVKSRQALQYTQDDWRRLESLMYDRFSIVFKDTRILLGEHMSDIDLVLNEKSSKLHFIDKTTLQFLLELSIVPQNRNLTKCRLSIMMSELRTTLSDVQYKLFLKIMSLHSSSENQDTSSVESVESVDTASEELESKNSKGLVPIPETPQKSFELKFLVSKAYFIIVKGWDAQPLVEMCLHEFQVRFWTLNGNPDETVSIKLKIADLLVTDHIDSTGPPELRKMIESHGGIHEADGNDEIPMVHDIDEPSGDGHSTDRPNLFVVNYKKNEAGDATVSVILSEIHFVCNPQSTLTVYDFIMSTFTSPTPQTPVVAASDNIINSQEPKIAADTERASKTTSSSSMNVQINMTGISVLLCDEQVPIGVLNLKRATLNAEMHDNLKLRVTLGEVKLMDEQRNNLVNIENSGNLADFRYETHPSAIAGNSGKSEIYLRLGAIRLTVIERSLISIIKIFNKLNTMKAVYDQARMMAFNQAIQVEPDKMVFDIEINTPAIVWPHSDGWIKFNLGQLHLQNKLSSTRNDIKGGIRYVRICSLMKGEEQEIFNKTELNVDVCNLLTDTDDLIPVTTVTSYLSPIHANLSEVQYGLLVQFMGVVSNISQSFGSIENNNDDVGILRRKLAEEKQIEQNQTSYWWGENFSLSLGGNSDQDIKNSKRPKLQFDFDAPLLDITLHLDEKPLSLFEIREVHADVSVSHEMDTIVNCHVKTFAAEDLNKVRCNKFPQIIPPVKNNAYQVIAKVVRKNNLPVRVDCSIDSPQVMVAVEYAIALKKFLDHGNSAPITSKEILSDTDDEYASSLDERSFSVAELDSQRTSDSASENVPINDGLDFCHNSEVTNMATQYCLNIVDMSLTVLADEKDDNSEAIVFKIEHLVLNSGKTTTCTISKIGMFLTQMKSFDSNRLRIIDDFNVVGTLDNSESSKTLLLTNAQLFLDPLVLRLSLREIGLIMDIAKKASSIYSNKQPCGEERLKQATTFRANDHRIAHKRRRSELLQSNANSSAAQNYGTSLIEEESGDMVRTKRVLSEKMIAELQGLRLVLIDPLHQLPLTDFCIKPFTLLAENWSDAISVNASAEFYANFHSFTKSAWEPLVDTIKLQMHVQKQTLEISSEDIVDVDISPEIIQLFNDIKSYFDADPSEFLRNRIEEEEPYRIINQTGMSIIIWQDFSAKGDLSRDGNTVVPKGNEKRKLIKDSEVVKWSFQDWRQLRENLSATDQDATLGLEFENADLTILRSIPVNKIGEHVYTLFDNSTKEKHRIIFDIRVVNHLKQISIRSSVLLHNDTEDNLEIMLITPGKSKDVLSLGACESIPLPVGKVESNMLIRKQGDTRWSMRSIDWLALSEHQHPDSSVNSHSSGAVKTTPLTLQCSENYFLSIVPIFKDMELNRKYPYLEINFTAPIQIVNNLPVDLEFQLYNREHKTKTSWDVKEAGHQFVHDVNPDNLILMRLSIPEYSCRRTAIVNIGQLKRNKEFHLEDCVEMTSQTRGQRLNLYLDYQNLPNGKGRAIIIYSHYVIINTSDHDLYLCDGNNTLDAATSSTNLWSFGDGSERRSQRVTIACDSSFNSAPVSLDASGSVFEVALMSKDRKSVLYLGGKITQGVGRYLSTKIVTISPRFILYNDMDRPLQFHEPGNKESNKVINVNPKSQSPVGFIKSVANREICTRLADSDECQWSSSLRMYNVGTTYVRLIENMKPTVLAQVDILLEGACLFVRFSIAKTWPFSIRNFTDHDFVFYQSDPALDEDDMLLEEGLTTDGNKSGNRFTPILYNLPPRSAMPYSWDFPAAETRQIVLQLPEHVQFDNDRGLSIVESRNASDATSVNQVKANGSSNRTKVSKQKIRHRKIQLGDIGELPPARLAHNVMVALSVIADGPQQALIIDNLNTDVTRYDVGTNEVKPEAFEEIKQLEDGAFVLKTKFKGLGLSCINGAGQELLYATFHNAQFSYSISDALQSISTQIQWIQVDNMLPKSTNFPVFIYPSVLPKAPDELAAHPCFSASMTRILDDSYGLTYIKHATLLLQEMTIEADEDLLLAIVNMIVDQTSDNVDLTSNLNPIFDNDLQLLSENETKMPAPAVTAVPDIYFEQLHLQPTQLNLSFMRTGALNTSSVFKNISLGGNLSVIVDALTMTIGNINDAPVRFNALLVDNVRTRVSNLVSMIRIHYEQEFVYQIHKIVGSADIIGNPVGLFNNISSGVMDLFYEPYLGYTLNDRPRELGVGLAKGGINFMKKSVFGLSDSLTKVTGSLSKGLVALTLDPQYQNQQRSRRIRNKPIHALSGIKYGVMSFCESITSGFTGLAEAPLQGAVTEGSVGFFKGLGIGLLGLPTKATIGVLDFASNVTEGIRNTTTVFDTHSVDRIRLPRVIFDDGVLRPYNVRDSVGQMILRTVKDSDYSGDHYLAHTNLSKNNVVVISLERILVASVSDMKQEWMLEYSSISSIILEQTGIVIRLIGGVHGPFIPLTEESTRLYIYRNITKSVEACNRHRIAFS